jgi:hypothetical protein
MILIEAYEALKDLQLTASQYEFSTDWLGMAPSYLSSAIARDRAPSAEALLTLGGKLARSADKMRRTFRHREADTLESLARRVWDDLECCYCGGASVIPGIR